MKNYLFDKFSKPVVDFNLTYEGFEADITEPYYWHLQFPLLVNTGHKMFKVEDDHYFSESSEKGAKFRAVKGQSISYYQQQFSALIELLKRQLLPALEEVKLAERYKRLFDDIESGLNDLKKEKDENKKKELKSKIDNAILTLKTKWVREVDNNTLYTISKSGEERGLDYALVDQLFFGVSITDPLNVDTISKQVDEVVLPIETTETTKRVIKDYLYRFYMWLPTALKQTKVTYSLRVNTLKQLYSQVKLYLKFLKPLLLEIAKKNERSSLDPEINYYQNFDELNPFIADLIDSSISHVKLLLIRDRKLSIDRLKFKKEGFPVKKGDFISSDLSSKEGFIVGYKEKGGDIYYLFKETGKNEIIEVHNEKMKKYSTMVFDFTQIRNQRMRDSPQGKFSSFYNINKIKYRGHAWDLYESASYVNKLKLEELDLLENFVADLSIIKEDLIKYVEDLSDIKDIEKPKKVEEVKKDDKKESEYGNILLEPFKGMYDLFVKPVMPYNLKSTFSVKKKDNEINKCRETNNKAKVKVMEEIWKTYTIFKKTHGFIQY